MNYKLNKVCIALLLLLCGGAARAQDGFNPQNPPDPYVLYKVVATANDGNYTSGSGSYTAGTVVTLNTSAASTVYVFKHWLKDGVVYSTNRQFSYTVEPENVTFRAVYDFNPTNPADPWTINERHLYLVPDPVGACSFNRTSGAKAETGSSILVTANPSQNYDFVGWYDQNDNVVSTSRSFNYTMPDADATLTARFAFNPPLPGDPESTQENIDMGIEMGDVNKDGSVDIQDVVLTVNYIIGKNPENFYSNYGDINNDGSVDIQDVVLFVNRIIGK